MKTVIIGGGPSGITSAIFASRNNEEVIVLERNDKVLKKLLITGNGRCNYFNEEFSINHYYSSNSGGLKKVICDKNKNMFLDFFDSIGIIPNIKNSCYYPFSNKASSVREVLLKEVDKSNIEIITSSYVNGVKKINGKFIVFYNDKEIICDRVILSTGSKSYPKTGSDGNGYDLAVSLGHSINRIYPSLVKLLGDASYFKKWDGVRSEVVVSLYENNGFVKKEFGEVQFTKDGISGICVFNLSNIVSKGLIYNNKEEVRINFMPFLREDPLEWFERQSIKVGNRTVFSIVEGFLNYKLIDIIFSINNISVGKMWYELSLSEKKNLVRSLTEFSFLVKDTASYDISQVCGGGICLEEINMNTMESKVVSGLYLVGEVLDVVGDCGGYNLGFAFISGILAGKRGIR